MNISENIFVSIASFRDTKCIDTLKDLYFKADNPDNIYCGIFTQIDNSNQNEQCYDFNFQYNVNVRRININFKEAKGPLWARIKIIKNLFQNEKYFLMIDAHTKFSKGWDTNLKSYLDFLKNKNMKPILSGYPANYDEINKNESYNKSFFMCEIVSGDKYPQMLKSHIKEGGYFYKSYLISANCFFTYGQFINEIDLVKFEDLKYIFSGEEILIALLGYVNGWDVYSIPYNEIFHKYKSSQNKIDDKTDWHKFSKINHYLEKESHKKLENILTSNKLDSIRKVSDFYKIFKNNFTNNDDLCKNPEKIKFN